MPRTLITREKGSVNRLERKSGRYIVRVEVFPRNHRSDKDVLIRSNGEASTAERIEAAVWMAECYGGASEKWIDNVRAWYLELWHEEM